MYDRYCWCCCLCCCLYCCLYCCWQLWQLTHFRFLTRVIVVLELCITIRCKNHFPRASRKPPPGSFLILEELVFAICFVQHYKKLCLSQEWRMCMRKICTGVSPGTHRRHSSLCSRPSAARALEARHTERKAVGNLYSEPPPCVIATNASRRHLFYDENLGRGRGQPGGFSGKKAWSCLELDRCSSTPQNSLFN